MHAYLAQTVSGLPPGTNYTLGGWMRYYESNFEMNGKFDVYMEAIGGLGSTSTPSITVGDGEFKTNASYRQYFLTQTADSNGQIEVRLHLKKYGVTSNADGLKLYIFNGCWDDMSLTLTQ
jgi:hypothetical protein